MLIILQHIILHNFFISRLFLFGLPWWLRQRRQWHPSPVLLPGKSHGWRSLVGCSPWGRQESDTTERLHFHFSLSCIREGNCNPLQCSCLENPRAAIYGVAQSWTRLKRLSSSSSSDSDSKIVCLQCWRPWFDPRVGKIPWRRKWPPTPVFLPGKFHGWRVRGIAKSWTRLSDFTFTSTIFFLS